MKKGKKVRDQKTTYHREIVRGKCLVWTYFFGFTLEFSLTSFKVYSEPLAPCLLVKDFPHLPNVHLSGEGSCPIQSKQGQLGDLLVGTLQRSREPELERRENRDYGEEKPCRTPSSVSTYSFLCIISFVFVEFVSSLMKCIYLFINLYLAFMFLSIHFRNLVLSHE